MLMEMQWIGILEDKVDGFGLDLEPSSALAQWPMKGLEKEARC